MKTKLIAFCDYPTVHSMTPKTWGSNGLDITLGVLDEKDGKPRNYSHDSHWDNPIPFGGFRMHIYPTNSQYSESKLAGWWTGPEMSCETKAEPYLLAGKAMLKLRAKISSYYETRGNPTDSVDELLRFLEATGVSQVYMRPKNSSQTMLSHGDWEVLKPVEIGNLIRRAFLDATKPAEKQEAV